MFQLLPQCFTTCGSGCACDVHWGAWGMLVYKVWIINHDIFDSNTIAEVLKGLVRALYTQHTASGFITTSEVLTMSWGLMLIGLNGQRYVEGTGASWVHVKFDFQV